MHHEDREMRTENPAYYLRKVEDAYANSKILSARRMKSLILIVSCELGWGYTSERPSRSVAT